MRLADVARRAGVSSATVSRVLNGTAPVDDETRGRVVRAVEVLKYVPHLAARALASGASSTLGVVVSNIENPFFLDVVRSLETEARAHGYEVLVGNTNYAPGQLVATTRQMLARRVDGLALIVSETDPQLWRELVAGSVPLVFYDVGPRATRSTRHLSTIRSDYASGVRALVDHLLGLGHRRFAFIGHHTTLAPLHDRQRAFVDYATRRRLVHQVLTADDGPAGGQSAARELLESGFAPTAILCTNDFMAIGVLRALHEHGLSVPHDISVTGFDDIGLAAMVTPALTTAHIPRERIGRLAFERLVPGGSRTGTRNVAIVPEVVVRESTGPVSGASRGRRAKSHR